MREQYPAITSLCLQHYSNKINAIYLYGSHADNTATKNSDIDLALLFYPQTIKNLPPLNASELHEELENLLESSVDLVLLNAASSILQKEVIFKGKKIYCANSFLSDSFEMHAISLYQKMNEERAEILQDFQQNNRAYAS